VILGTFCTEVIAHSRLIESNVGTDKGLSGFVFIIILVLFTAAVHPLEL